MQVIMINPGLSIITELEADKSYGISCELGICYPTLHPYHEETGGTTFQYRCIIYIYIYCYRA
jgi:hypothetical protein